MISLMRCDIHMSFSACNTFDVSKLISDLITAEKLAKPKERRKKDKQLK